MDEEDPSFIDMRRFGTNDYQYSEEIQKMKEKEDEENRRKLKEFKDLLSESRIDDMKAENFMNDEEKKKIEKVKERLSKLNE